MSKSVMLLTYVETGYDADLMSKPVMMLTYVETDDDAELCRNR